MIRYPQADYYKVFGACDKAGHSTPFIELLLWALLTALREVSATDQVSDQVAVLRRKALPRDALLQGLHLSRTRSKLFVELEE